MPDESIVVTPLMSSRILFFPWLSALVMISRSCWSPEPMVIFPSSLMISTPFTLRELAFIIVSSYLAGCDSGTLGQVLRHQQRGSSAGVERVVHLVHERFHIEDA